MAETSSISVDSLSGLSGHQKLAVLCMTLGSEAASEITRQLPSDDVERISAEIARIERVDPRAAERILDEWEDIERGARTVAGGGAVYAREVLERAFDEGKASAIMTRIGDFKPRAPTRFDLRHLEGKQLASVLGGEHPQALALVLAHLEGAQAAAVIDFLAKDLAADVLHRMATMGKVAPEVIDIVADLLQSGTAVYVGGEATHSGGPESVAEILKRVSGKKDELLQALEVKDPDMSNKLRHLMFVFEDLVRLDKRALQNLLQQVETKDLALSLKVVSDALREKIEEVMSQRALSSLRTEIEFLGPVRVSEVEEAQQRVVGVARGLEETGEIVLVTDDDDEVIE